MQKLKSTKVQVVNIKKASEIKCRFPTEGAEMKVHKNNHKTGRESYKIYVQVSVWVLLVDNYLSWYDKYTGLHINLVSAGFARMRLFTYSYCKNNS